MEKKQEIKDAVKQRVIDMLAEQIIKEESFANLKTEIISDLLEEPIEQLNIVEVPIATELEITPPIDEKKIKRDLKWLNEFGFTYDRDTVKATLEKMSQEQGIKISAPGTRRDFKKTLKEIQSGKLDKRFLKFPIDNSNEKDWSEKTPLVDLRLPHFTNEDIILKSEARNLIQEKMLKNFSNLADYSAINVNDIKTMENDTNYKRIHKKIDSFISPPSQEAVSTSTSMTDKLTTILEMVKAKKSKVKKEIKASPTKKGKTLEKERKIGSKKVAAGKKKK